MIFERLFQRSAVVVTCIKLPIAEFYEEMLSLIQGLTAAQISPNMWQAFHMLYDLFKKDNIDYFTGTGLLLSIVATCMFQTFTKSSYP